jgi:hypothetical protein
MNLGVILENLNTGHGSVAVARHLENTYVPTNGMEVHKLVLFGDQGTFEQVIQAKRACATSINIPHGRLMGLEPGGQEFHKRGIYNQVAFSLNQFVIFHWLLLIKIKSIIVGQL